MRVTILERVFLIISFFFVVTDLSASTQRPIIIETPKCQLFLQVEQKFQNLILYNEENLVSKEFLSIVESLKDKNKEMIKLLTSEGDDLIVTSYVDMEAQIDQLQGRFKEALDGKLKIKMDDIQADILYIEDCLKMTSSYLCIAPEIKEKKKESKSLQHIKQILGE